MPFDKILFDDAPLEIIGCDKDENYPKPNEFLENEYCLFLNITNIKNYGFNFEKTDYISKEKDESLIKGKLKRGDIVLIIKSHLMYKLGDAAFYGENIDFKNIRINSNIVILRTKDNLLSQFLFYFLQSNYFKKQIMSYKHLGIPTLFLPISALKNIEFYFPSLNQQKAIVDFISQFDKKIELYKKINENLEEQLKTIYNSFFLYFDEFCDEDLKESEIGLIPNQWDLLCLGEITTEIKEYTLNDDFEMFSVRDTGNLSLFKEYYKPHFKNGAKKKIVKQNEFAYDPYRIIKRSFIGRNNFDFDGCVNPRNVVFKVEEGYENFMNMYIKSNRFYHFINTPLAIRPFNYDDFSMIKIAYPPKELINKFNSIYENYQNLINHNQTIIYYLRKIKELLLPKLISGEISC